MVLHLAAQCAYREQSCCKREALAQFYGALPAYGSSTAARRPPASRRLLPLPRPRPARWRKIRVLLTCVAVFRLVSTDPIDPDACASLCWPPLPKSRDAYVPFLLRVCVG